MSLLFSNEILNSIKEELKKASESVQIISAYCKNETFTYLNNCVSNEVKIKRLLIRFRMDDILKGSTDFSVIEHAKEEKWKVYIRFDLHAKTYIVDNKRGLVGSANATNSGLSIGKYGNLEMATLIDIESKDISKVDKLFDYAIYVDDILMEKMKSQIKSMKPSQKRLSSNWDESIVSMFNPHIETLFSYELPEKYDLQKGEYLSFLDKVYDGDIEKLKEIFRWSNAYLWLLNTLKENNGCLYFGGLTQMLHDVLVSDPKPYRKDVKVMLSNLLDLVEKLCMDDIFIDKPNFSQRVRLRNTLSL